MLRVPDGGLREKRCPRRAAPTNRFTQPIERITGRRVRAFVSGIDANADVASEMFVLEPETRDDERSPEHSLGVMLVDRAFFSGSGRWRWSMIAGCHTPVSLRGAAPSTRRPIRAFSTRGQRTAVGCRRRATRRSVCVRSRVDGVLVRR